MSTGYEIHGRTRQKRRTREALLAAARQLLASGTVPTIDQAAEAAAISRTTAYRYFSSQSALLLAAHPELTPASLLPADAPSDVAARLDSVVGEITNRTVAGESSLRAMLRLSLSPGATHDQLALRRGRAIGWIEDALAPAAGALSPSERRQLACAIRSATGIEALVWLTDVAGLDRDDAVALQRWSARALLSVALDDRPPPARSRRRSHARPRKRARRSGRKR